MNLDGLEIMTIWRQTHRASAFHEEGRKPERQAPKALDGRKREPKGL